MDSQVANIMEEASSGIYQGAEKFFCAMSMQVDLNAMLAENQERSVNGHTLAYGESDFYKLRESYEEKFNKL
jgi:hypothetical protein